MRFAGQALSFPGDQIDNRYIQEGVNSYQEMQEVEPGTYIGDEVTYPQDNAPASFFGVEPTAVPLRLDRHMLSPEGGISRLPDFEQGPAQGPNTPIKWYPKGENKGNYWPERV